MYSDRSPLDYQQTGRYTRYLLNAQRCDNLKRDTEPYVKVPESLTYLTRQLSCHCTLHKSLLRGQSEGKPGIDSPDRSMSGTFCTCCIPFAGGDLLGPINIGHRVSANHLRINFLFCIISSVSLVFTLHLPWDLNSVLTEVTTDLVRSLFPSSINLRLSPSLSL